MDPPTTGTLGHRLRVRREQRRLRRVDAARATRVGAHHLAALEHDDLDELFEDERAEAWVRAYAEYLDLDSDEAVAEFLRVAGERRPARASPESAGEPAPAAPVPSEERGTLSTVATDGSASVESPSPEEQPPQAAERQELAWRQPEPISPQEVARQLYGSPDAGEPPSGAEDGAAPPASSDAEEDETPREATKLPTRLVVGAVVGATILALAWIGLRERKTPPPSSLPSAGVEREARSGPPPEPPLTAIAAIEGERADDGGVDPAQSDDAPPVESAAGSTLESAADAAGEPSIANTQSVGSRAPPPAPAGPVAPPSTTTKDPPADPVDSELAIDEHGVGTGVENHRLVGQANRFTEGERVYYWTRVRGGAPGTKILHVWIHEGRQISSATLEVGSANWRTHSRKTLFPGSAGEWRVEARDASGHVLARREFVCAPREGAAAR